jgi:hypothetical protein
MEIPVYAGMPGLTAESILKLTSSHVMEGRSVLLEPISVLVTFLHPKMKRKTPKTKNTDFLITFKQKL